MHIENGNLILGLHDLDHVLGDPAQLGVHLQTEYFEGASGSDAFLEVLDQSGELWMGGIADDATADMPIRQQLAALGVQRIVIRLEAVMTGGAGVNLTIETPGERAQRLQDDLDEADMPGGFPD